MLDEYGGSSDDDIPDWDTVIRQYQHKVQDAASRESAKEKTSATSKTKSQAGRSTKEEPTKSTKSNPGVKATPLRRRKLGQSQTVDGSLLKPWNGRAKKEEKDRQDSNSGSSRARPRGPNTETGISSKDTSKFMPAKANKTGPRTVSLNVDRNTLEKEKDKPKPKPKPKQDGGGPDGQTKNAQLSEEIKELVALLGEFDDDESDILGDKKEPSGEESSEFISISDSESDAWNSGSGISSTQPTRRSRSPNDQWARPQRTLFANPGKKTASSNEQTKTTTTDPTKHASKPRKQNDSHLSSFKAPQLGNLEDVFQKLQM